MKEIKAIVDTLRDYFNITNESMIKRYRKNSLDFIINVIGHKLVSNSSYEEVAKDVIKSSYKGNTTISDQSINEFRQKMHNEHLELFELAKSLIPDSMRGSIFGVDGTLFDQYLHKKLKISNLKNKQFNTYHVTVIYDVINEIIINIIVSFTKDERQNIINNLHLFKKNDFLICDAGYISHEFIKTLNNNKIGFLIRSRKDLAISKHMIAQNLTDYIAPSRYPKYCGIRFIRYVIDNNNYFFATSSNASVIYLKKLYHSRWYTEEFIDLIKNTFNLAKTKTRIFKLFIQEIYVCLFYTVLAKVLQKYSIDTFHHTSDKNTFYSSFYKSDCVPSQSSYKLNMTNTVNRLIKDIFPDMLYADYKKFELYDNNNNIINNIKNIPPKYAKKYATKRHHFKIKTKRSNKCVPLTKNYFTTNEIFITNSNFINDLISSFYISLFSIFNNALKTRMTERHFIRDKLRLDDKRYKYNH